MTVYYAQNSSVNINAANVWNTAANGSGSYVAFGDLTSADVLMANGKAAITVNVDTTVSYVMNGNDNGATAGGYFEISSGGITLTANVTAGGTAVTNKGCLTFSHASGTSYLVGNTTGGTATSALGCYVAGLGSVSATGSIIGGSGSLAYGLNIAASTTVSVIGPVYGGNGTNAHGINNSTGSPTVTVTGSINAASGIGVYSNQSSAVTINGTITASAIKNGFMAASETSLNVCSGPLVNIAGRMAVWAPNLLITLSPATYWTFTGSDVTTDRSMYTADSVGGNPAISNVRHGTTFGPANELTGTAYIPAAASVVAGVPVDATVGTADLLTAADVRSAIGLASANLDTQLSAIPTTGLTAQQVWEYVSRTLTAGSGITAQDVWEYATRELTSSAGATAEDVWTYATRSLTEAPDVPTVEEIAAEVRTELTPELSRVANCATVESTGDQLASLL
jgi:hypothetical protein